jgi:dihydrofolate synthase/folylpolyglutamate synthase
MEINELLTELYSLTHGAMTHDTQRMKELSLFLDEPHKNYPIIHVAGTNGKSSVCCMLASILQENGYKVGLYTSPHIIKFNERIRINGECISDEDIIKTYELIRDISQKNNASFFEITTAIAFEYFSNNKVDFAIIETGLGGRLDSTNIITPILSIITSISQDHIQILGKSITKIASEKAGIIKKNVPVIVQDINPKIINILLKQAEKMSAPMYVNYDFPHVEFIKYNNNEMIYNVYRIVGMIDFLTNKEFCFNIDSQNISLEQRTSSLLGTHQINNIKTVRFAVLLLSTNFSIKKGTIDNGIRNIVKNTGLRFRIENVSSDPANPMILDVSHNSQSIKVLVDTLTSAYSNKKWNFIFAAMKDKNISQMLQYILPICKKLTIVNPKIERAAKPTVIQKKAIELGFNNIVIEEDITIACKEAKLLNEPVVVCGTFFIMKEAIESLQLNNMF